MRIHEELQDGRITNCTKLAELLEVSTKTVSRDLAFMRDRMGLPLDYDAQIYAWRYTYPVKSFPTVAVSEGELVALMIAQKALAQYRGTTIYEGLEMAFGKLAARLGDNVSFSTAESVNGVSFGRFGVGRKDLEIFGELNRAILKSVEIKFCYRKPGSDETEHRTLRPYHLAERLNMFYLIGHDLDRQALRHFSLARISQLKISAIKFIRPPNFSGDNYFAKSFGVYVGDGDYTVILRFNAHAADKIREREWHPSQSVRELPKGELELTLQLDDLREITHWVLGWGEQVRVILPNELKKHASEIALNFSQHFNKCL